MGRLLPMNNVKNLSILVAVDGSVSSNNALKQAANFAKKHKCLIRAVAVAPPFEGDLDFTGVVSRDAMMEPAKKVLSDAKKVAEEIGIAMGTSLAIGTIHETIVDTAVEHDCNLIVIGRRGLTRLERVFMGSVTARVIGFSPVDVLVMPYNSPIKWDNILLASDGSQCSDAATNKAIRIAQTYGGEINILSVVDVPAEAYAEAPDVIEKMVEKSREMVGAVEVIANAAGVNAGAFVREGTAHEKIVNMADEVQADMICLGSYGRTGVKRFLMGSVTERVIGQANCPVLVVKC